MKDTNKEKVTVYERPKGILTVEERPGSYVIRLFGFIIYQHWIN